MIICNNYPPKPPPPGTETRPRNGTAVRNWLKTVPVYCRMGWKKEELLMSTHPSPLRAECAGKIPPTRTLPIRQILYRFLETNGTRKAKERTEGIWTPTT